MKKAMGEEKEDEDTQMTQGHLQKLVTADGTYATQSAFSSVKTSKKEQERSVSFDQSLGHSLFICCMLCVLFILWEDHKFVCRMNRLFEVVSLFNLFVQSLNSFLSGVHTLIAVF